MPDPNTQQGRKSIEELIKGAPTPITLPTTPPNASLSTDTANNVYTGGPSSTSIGDSENAGHPAGQSSVHRAVTNVVNGSNISTPGRPTLGSKPTPATIKDVENQLDFDLEKYRNTGINAIEFLRNALMLNEDELKDVKGRIDAVTMNVTKSDAYKAELEAFKSVTAVASGGKSTATETDMYDPFVKMGNMLLEELEKENQSKSKQVRLCHNGSYQVVRGQRGGPAIKPDILLVPKSVAENRRKKLRNIHIRQVLSPFEFKLKKNPGNGIRLSCEADDTDIPTSTSQAVEADSVQTMPVISTIKSGVSVETAGGGKKRKAGQQVTDESNKAARPEEGCTAGSASRKKNTDKPGARVIDTDPHGRRQLARYAAAVLSDRGDRKFVYGVRVNAREMTFVFYHRSGIVEADAFDVCEHPEYLSLFLYMFQHDPTTYGFNATTGYWNPFATSPKTGMIKMNIKDKLVEKNEEYVESGVYDDLKIEKQEAAEYCIVGRGGSVHKVVAPNHNPKKVPAMAVKFSWQSTSRKHEIENMEIARKSIAENVAKTYGHATIEDDSPFEALRNACSHPQEKYTKKTFRVLVMKHYRRLSEVDDMEIFWELIRQLIICLHKLYVEQKLLHRDISIGNLAWDMVNGKPVIIILDFELATVVGDNVRINEVRTGTAPFMAREVLQGFESGYRHTLNHDLESVYYIAYWHAVGYRGYNLPVINKITQDPLNRWWNGSYTDMCREKENHMDKGDANLLIRLERDAISISVLFAIRLYYKKRIQKIDAFIRAQTKEKEDTLCATLEQACMGDLPLKERFVEFRKKQDEFGVEEVRKPTLGLSFKEWLAAGIFFPKDVMEGHTCQCDSCLESDELAKYASSNKPASNSQHM